MSKMLAQVITFAGALAISSQAAFAGPCAGICEEVPEPTSIALTSVGMAMVGAMAWKRNRNK